MKTVWVIEQGSYSDYRVVGVFTSKANAQKVCNAINAAEKWDDATLAEWPLDPAIEELNAGMSQFYVTMTRNGDVETVQNSTLRSYDLAGEVELWKRPKHMGKPWVLRVTTWATDEKHAVKIANEKRIGMLAADKWSEKENG